MTNENSEQKSIYYADMSRCLPASSLSRQQKSGCWYLVDYTTQGGMKGITMYAPPEDEAPPVSLPIEQQGWYSIYIGVNYHRSQEQTGDSPTGFVRVKLETDGSYTEIGSEVLLLTAKDIYPSKMGILRDFVMLHKVWNSIYEVYWKSVNLDGQKIIIAPPKPQSQVANLAWVRLVPLSEDEVDLLRIDTPTDKTRNLAACYCLSDLTGNTAGNDPYHPTEEGYIKDKIEPFRDSDFRIMLWEGNRGDACVYPTKIARMSEDDRWNPEWIDPLRVGIDYGHECGMEVFYSQRMAGVGPPIKRTPLQVNRFAQAHQQFAIRDAEGFPATNLSVAFPEVRQRWISLLREGVEYGVDGVHLNLNRSTPFVLYEEPSLTSFMEKTGQDPRELPFDDKRWCQHRADFVTQFFREIRQMLKEEGDKKGRTLSFAVTYYFHPTALYWAMDPPKWVKEGLVDYLMPQLDFIRTNALMPDPLALPFPKVLSMVKNLAKITEDTDVKIYPDVFRRETPGEVYAKEAADLYRAGADGFSFWSSEMRAYRASEMAVLRRLGHRDQLKRYADEAPGYWRLVPLKNLAGISGYYSYSDG